MSDRCPTCEYRYRRLCQAKAEYELQQLKEHIGVCDKCGGPLSILESVCWPCHDEWMRKSDEKAKKREAGDE